MKLSNHTLSNDPSDKQKVSFVESPNKQGALTPSLVVIHYTASTKTSSAVNWFKNPTAKASAHLVIGRDGEVVQMVKFNEKAWHAGASNWGALQNLNSHSIGIELVNAGRLIRSPDCWKSYTGEVVPDFETKMLRYKNEVAASCWQTYTEAQLASLDVVLKALCSTYAIKEILGHEDIAPGRKSDPGPAFPMQKYKAFVTVK